MKINKGDTLFFKGKYGMYYEVVVLSVEGEHAMVQGNRWSFGKKKVRIEKLRKQPSKEFIEMSKQVQKDIEKGQAALIRAKNQKGVEW